MSTFKLCGFDVGLQHRFFLIAGPCVIESEQSAIDIAGELKEMTSALQIPFIYKSSFDKANRSSGTSFRGLGMERGLEILAKVKREIGVPVLTDIHDISEIEREISGRVNRAGHALREWRPVEVRKYGRGRSYWPTRSNWPNGQRRY